MRTTSTRRRLAALSLSVGIALMAFGLFAPNANADTGPTAYDDVDDGQPGTRDCEFYGETLLEFKINNQPTDDDYDENTAGVAVKGDLPDGFFIRISNVDDSGANVVFDWEAFVADGDDAGTDPDPFPIDIVLVKAGPGGNEYTYTAPGAVSDEGLVSPKDSISHVTFCFDIPEEETTTTEAPTTTEGPTTTEAASVLGNVVTPAAAPASLPVTGSSDLTLLMVGTGLILVGGGAMLIRRDLLGRS